MRRLLHRTHSDRSTSTALPGLLIYIGLLVFLVFRFPFHLFPSPDSAWLVRNGERLDGRYLSPDDLPASGWQAVRLPDNWRTRQNGGGRDAWYRFHVKHQPADAEVLAVYLPTVYQNASVYLNGRWIGQGGRFEKPLSRLWSHPLLFRFSSDLISPGANTLLVRLATHRNASGYLSPVYLGPEAALAPAWKWRRFIKVELLAFFSYLLIIIGMIHLVLWLLRRQDSYYLWYALATLFWGLRGYLLLETELPVSNALWDALKLITLGSGVVFVVLFIQRFFGYRSKAFDAGLALYAIPAALPLLFMDVETVHWYGHHIWVMATVVLATWVSVFLYLEFRRNGHRRALMLLYVGLPLFVVGVRDLLVLNDRWDPSNGFLINYASPPVLLLAMWFILKRFVQSLSDAEELNVSLDRRVREKEREIHSHYKNAEKMRQRELLVIERDRIMRDMHDGLGGHLVGLQTLASVEQADIKAIRAQVDRALTDLRLVINSLDVTSQTLSTLLGSMRTRWQKLANAQKIKLVWQVSGDSGRKKLGPGRTLHIMRILEEAFTNSLKHSGADTITVSSGEDAQTAWASIRDNGQSKRSANPGRGVENMRHRARQLGGKLRFDLSASGAEVRLSFPGQVRHHN